MSNPFDDVNRICQSKVSDFIDSVLDREAKRRHNVSVINSIAVLAEEPFSRYWDNPKDAEYDDL